MFWRSLWLCMHARARPPDTKDKARVQDYMAKLSEASKITLRHQGGPMSEEECAECEADPRWPLVIRMRGYDEAGKDPSKGEGDPEFFRPAIRANLEASLRAQLESSQSSEVEKKRFPCSNSSYAAAYILSEEQLARWDVDGFLMLRNALNKETLCKLGGFSHIRLFRKDGRAQLFLEDAAGRGELHNPPDSGLQHAASTVSEEGLHQSTWSGDAAVGQTLASIFAQLKAHEGL